MLERLASVNYLAVLVAGLVSFFLGALWYMPLFGKLWIRLHGYSEEKVKEMQAKMNPAVFFGGMIASYLAAALALAFLIVNFNVKWAPDGALLGLAVWVVVAAAAMTAHLASQRHIGLYAIDTSFYLVFLLFMGVLLTMWR